MKKIKLVGFDPALSNLGIAHAEYDLETGELAVVRISLVQTEHGKSAKVVRQNSDDLRRARELYSGMSLACRWQNIAIAEIPTGTQSARGAMSNGIMIGVLASCSIPLVQVQPTEVKMASVGIKTATKGEMIEWAMKEYPKLGWMMRKSKGSLVPMNDNEHMADACAALHAGVKTDEFKQAVALYKGVLGK